MFSIPIVAGEDTKDVVVGVKTDTAFATVVAFDGSEISVLFVVVIFLLLVGCTFVNEDWPVLDLGLLLPGAFTLGS